MIARVIITIIIISWVTNYFLILAHAKATCQDGAGVLKCYERRCQGIKGLFTWSGGPRSSGVGFFCFHALGDTKQKKPTLLDRGLTLHVNKSLKDVLETKTHKRAHHEGL